MLKERRDMAIACLNEEFEDVVFGKKINIILIRLKLTRDKSPLPVE